MTNHIMRNEKEKGVLYFCRLIGFSVAVAINAAAAENPFVVALRGKPPQSLGPTSYRSNDLAIVSQIMEGLFKFNPMKPGASPEPNLAESVFKIDPLTYIVELRDDVVFHPFPGHPTDRLTAHDVKFSIDKAKLSESQFKDRMQNISTVEVHGNSVKIKLKREMKDLLAVLATSIGYITSATYYNSLGQSEKERRERFNQAPLGTGPFLLGTPLTERCSTIILYRFTGYREKTWATSKRALSSVAFQFYEQPRSILNDFGAGKIALTSLPATEFGLGGNLQGKGQLIELTPPFLVLLTINTRKELLRDERTRRILNAAVDVREIARMCPTSLKGLPGGFKKFMEIPLESLQTAGTQRLHSLLSDPITKRNLKALQKGGPFRILAPERPDHIMDRVLDRIEFDLEQQLGLRVDVIKVPSVSLQSIREINPDLIYREWTPDTPWEQADLSILRTLFAPNSPNNYGGYQDNVVKNYFDRLQNTDDPGTTEKTYKDVQDRLRQGAPLIWLPIARQMTLFLKGDYRATFFDPSRKPSSLIFYTSMLKEIRKRH